MSYWKQIVCSNAQHKLHIFRRVRRYLTLGEAKLFGNAFIWVIISGTDMNILLFNSLFKNAKIIIIIIIIIIIK